MYPDNVHHTCTFCIVIKIYTVHAALVLGVLTMSNVVEVKKYINLYDIVLAKKKQSLRTHRINISTSSVFIQI